MAHGTIRLATAADRPAIDAIYAHYVLTSTCTYQEVPDPDAARRAWFESHGERHPVTVLEHEGDVLGWASLSPWKERSGYRFTCEWSVYIRDDARGRGFGRRLLADMLERAGALGYHAIIGGVSADQEASLRLHEAMGFERVAHFREAGFKFGRWLDVIYLERRLDATA